MRLSKLKKLVTEREKILLMFIVMIMYFVFLFGGIDAHAANDQQNFVRIEFRYGTGYSQAVIKFDSTITSLKRSDDKYIGAPYNQQYYELVTTKSDSFYVESVMNSGDYTPFAGNTVTNTFDYVPFVITSILECTVPVYENDGTTELYTPPVVYQDAILTHSNSLDGSGIMLHASNIDERYTSMAVEARQFENDVVTAPYVMNAQYTGEILATWPFYKDVDGYDHELETTFHVFWYVDGLEVHSQWYTTQGFENYVNTDTGLDTNIAGSASSNEFTVNFNESTFDITANYRSYGNLKIQFYDKENEALEDDISWLSNVFGDAIIDIDLSKGETKTFGYPNDPEWGEDYWIVVYEESSLNSSVELPTWATWFRHGSTSQTDGTGSSSIMDSIDTEVESLEQAYAEATEAVTNATRGIAFIGAVMTMFPYPFNVISIVVIAGVGVVLSVGLALTLLGR